MAAMATVKREWQEFKRDQPGRRFQNQRRRMREGSKALMVAQISLGVVLIAGGAVLLVIPGPGIPLIVFGLAMLAGMSKRLATVLDRIEPSVRRVAIKARDTWRGLPLLAKIGLGVIAAVGVAAFGYAMYRLWFT
jgi:hypothetical protein